eukprot:94513-Rhodomonas_salina.1
MGRLFNDEEVLTFPKVYAFLTGLMTTNVNVMEWPYVTHTSYFVKHSETIQDTNVWTNATQNTPTSCLCTPMDMVSRHFPFLHVAGDDWREGNVVDSVRVQNEEQFSILRNMTGRWQLIPMEIKPGNSSIPITAVSSGVPPLVLTDSPQNLLRYAKVYIDSITAITNKVECFLRAHVLGRITDEVLANVRDKGAGLSIIRWNALTIDDMKSLLEFIGNKEAGYCTNSGTANNIQQFIYLSVQPFLQAVNSALERLSRMEKALGDAIVYKDKQEGEKKNLHKDLRECLRVVYVTCTETNNQGDILAPLSQLFSEKSYMDAYVSRSDIESAFTAVQLVLKQHRQTSGLLQSFAEELENCLKQSDRNLEQFFTTHPGVRNATLSIQTIMRSVDRLVEERNTANANTQQCIETLESKGYVPRDRTPTESHNVILLDQVRRVQNIDPNKATVPDNNMQCENEEVQQLKEQITRLQLNGVNLERDANAYRGLIENALLNLSSFVSTLGYDEQRDAKISEFIGQTKEDGAKQVLAAPTCEQLGALATFVKASFDTRKKEAASSLDKDNTIELLRKEMRNKTAELEAVNKELAAKRNMESLYNDQLATARQAQEVVKELSHGKFTEAIYRITACLGDKAPEDPNDVYNTEPLRRIMQAYTVQNENILKTMKAAEFPAQQQDSLLALTALHGRLQAIFRSADRVLSQAAPSAQAAAAGGHDYVEKENAEVLKAAQETGEDTTRYIGAMAAQADEVTRREVKKRGAEAELREAELMHDMLTELGKGIELGNKRHKPNGDAADDAGQKMMQAHVTASRMVGLPPHERVLIIGAKEGRRKTRLASIPKQKLGKIVYQVGLTELVADLLLSLCKAMSEKQLIPGTQEAGPRAAMQTYQWTQTVITNTLIFIEKEWRTDQQENLVELMLKLRDLHHKLIVCFSTASPSGLPELRKVDISKIGKALRMVGDHVNSMVRQYHLRYLDDSENEDVEDSSLEDTDENASE